MEAGGPPDELGRGVRIPGHVLYNADESISEEEVVATVDRIREDLTDYLDPDEQIITTYSGFGTSFAGAGKGLYVFAATDRRFMLLDDSGTFAEVDYDAVTSIDRESGVHNFEKSVSKARAIKLSAGALIVCAVLVPITNSAIFSLGILASLGATAHFTRKHFTATESAQVPYEDIVIRTPSSSQTSHTVQAEADHFLGTMDVDVETEHSERYVIRQWLRPEELSDKYTENEYLNFEGPTAFGTEGLVAEPEEFEVRLSRILREHR